MSHTMTNCGYSKLITVIIQQWVC